MKNKFSVVPQNLKLAKMVKTLCLDLEYKEGSCRVLISGLNGIAIPMLQMTILTQSYFVQFGRFRHQ
jgi:hypothetical protein